MHRRQFMAAAAGGLAAGVLGACASSSGQRRRPLRDQGNRRGSLERRAALRADCDSARSHTSSAATGPAALFLHGFPLSSFQWRGAFDRLAGERRCVAADFLGLGFTQVAAGQSCAPSAAGRDAGGVARLAFDLDGRSDRERQRRRRRATVRPALSAARPHDAADELRRRAGQPAAGTAAGARCGPRRQVRRNVARAVRREHSAGAHEGRARRPDVHVSGEPHRRGDRSVPRAAGELAGAQER